MAGVNKVILIGNLGKDPEIRTFETGAKKASFSLATTEAYKDRDGNRVETTEWHNIVCWRNLADIAEKYLTKGKQIYVEGKLRNRSWEDNGVKKYITEIEASTFTMLGLKGDDTNRLPESRVTPPTPPQEQTPPNDEYQGVDDLPF
ncbi:single-stranded DNA-binding protein [Bacteroidales bacterium OttesenSCG-928-B11]|nr:single-stranded DNA-binding protein [Bacteroidales bacterium OttesenSCG-928-B11]MDL2325914.1 single-stranded DNA-binding protein [Bacteroidales bacterium OttesenSCG-928-A14]